MKVFSGDVSTWGQDYERQGWVHVRDGATSEFCDHVRGLVDASHGQELHGKGLSGSKDQLLLEFPPELDLEADLLVPMAELAGLDPERITISERHIKVYSGDANPLPRAHKDRHASQLSLGISIAIPEGSHLVLFPDQDVEVNPLLRVGLVDSLHPSRQPEAALAGARPLELHDRPGDVVAFRGSAVWHLRRNSASTVMAYIKCNDFGSDPLGEDPRSASRMLATRDLLLDDALFSGSIPQLGARFESVTREYARDFNSNWLNINVWDQPPRMISDVEMDALMAVDNVSTVSTITRKLASSKGARAAVLAAFARLCELGALDLFHGF